MKQMVNGKENVQMTSVQWESCLDTYTYIVDGEKGKVV